MGQPRVSSVKAEPHQPVLICLLPWAVPAHPSFPLPLTCFLIPYSSLPSSLPLAPSFTHFSSHPFPSRCLSSPQCPVTRAKLGQHCGVSPLWHTLLVSPNPSLNPKNLLGAGISLRLPATHAFPAMLVPAAPGLHKMLGRRQGDLRDADPIRAHGSCSSVFQGAQAAASRSEGARGEDLGHGWQVHGRPCSNNHRNM